VAFPLATPTVYRYCRSATADNWIVDIAAIFVPVAFSSDQEDLHAAIDRPEPSKVTAVPTTLAAAARIGKPLEASALPKPTRSSPSLGQYVL